MPVFSLELLNLSFVVCVVNMLLCMYMPSMGIPPLVLLRAVVMMLVEWALCYFPHKNH